MLKTRTKQHKQKSKPTKTQLKHKLSPTQRHKQSLTTRSKSTHIKPSSLVISNYQQQYQQHNTQLLPSPFSSITHMFMSTSLDNSTADTSTPDAHQPQQKKQQQQQQQQQKSNKKQPQKKRPELVNKKDFASVFAQHFPNGTLPYVDTHCHLDAILDRLNVTVKNKAAKLGGCCPDEPATSNTNASDISPDTQHWDIPRLIKETHLGTWDACVTVCCEPQTFDPIMEIIDKDTSGKIFGAFGIHPHEAKHWNSEIQAKFEKAMEHPKVVAWGECGLDYFYNFSETQQQKDVFIKQIELAAKYNKPLVVHTREAEDDTVEIMLKHCPKDMFMHIHCCTSSPKMVQPLLDHFPNLYVGFTGVITFKTAEAIQETVSIVPLDRLLLETDGPYMAPMPFRGAVAHSGMVPFTAVKMAEIKNVPLDDLLKQVRENTRKIYGI